VFNLRTKKRDTYRVLVGKTEGLRAPEIKVKLKESRNRSDVTQRVPGGLGSEIFMTFGT
jgi:hypothetical protein